MVMIFGLVLVAITLLFGHFYKLLIWRPQRVRSKILQQGIGGPSPTSFLVGNIPEMKTIRMTTMKQKEDHNSIIDHHWPPSLFPHLYAWTNTYGPTFMYSTGKIQLLCTTEIELVKQVSLSTSLTLGKPSYLSKDHGPLLGQGIISSSGPTWAHQRKIIAPEFYMDKIKGMLKLMSDSTLSMLKLWESRVESEGGVADMRIDGDLRSLSADIIARACFGSNYSQGEEIFVKLRQLQKLMSTRSVGIPGLRHVPTKTNRQVWKLQKDIDSMILNVVKQRAKSSCEKDLLQMILESANTSEYSKNKNMHMGRDKFIIDNCKNVYFAGHETTATTASWCLMLLAKYPEWQDRARAEVLRICNKTVPDAHMLQNMKVLTMVIQETLRLYPPAGFFVRETREDMEFKGIKVPKGVNIQIPVFAIQQDTELWGVDAHQFNPERFANGVLGACKSPLAYMPFGAGSRICVGNHFAMTELKMLLSLALSNFTFSISPAYTHSPSFKMVIEPGLGVQLCLQKV